MAACGSGFKLPAFLPTAEVRLERVTVPADLLACTPEPAPLPAEPWPTNEDFGAWVAGVRLAGRDCRSKLDAIRELQGKP